MVSVNLMLVPGISTAPSRILSESGVARGARPQTVVAEQLRQRGVFIAQPWVKEIQLKIRASSRQRLMRLAQSVIAQRGILEDLSRNERMNASGGMGVMA